MRRDFTSNDQLAQASEQAEVDAPRLGAAREEFMKPALYLALCLLGIALGALGARLLLERLGGVPAPKARQAGWLAAAAGVAGLAAAAWSPQLLAYMTFDRFTLDANHFWIAFLLLAGSAIAWLLSPPGVARSLLLAAMAVAAVTGGLMLAGRWWLSYTLFDAAVPLPAVLLALQAARKLAAPPAAG